VTICDCVILILLLIAFFVSRQSKKEKKMKKLIWLITPVWALPTKHRRIILVCCLGVSTASLIFVLFQRVGCYAVPSILITVFLLILTITFWKDR